MTSFISLSLSLSLLSLFSLSSLSLCAGPFLSKLPTDHYSLIKWNCAQPDPTFSYCGAGTLAPTTHHLPVSVVIYVVTRSTGAGDGSAQEGYSSAKSEEVLKTLQLFSEMLATDVIPEDTKSRITLQVSHLAVCGICLPANIL